MFLIEYKKGSFVNGELIDCVRFEGNKFFFTLTGDSETLFKVDKTLEKTFANHLQAINSNLTNIQIALEESKGDL